MTEPSREQPVSEDVEDAAELNTDVSADGISYCFIDRSGNIRLDADAAEPMETEVGFLKITVSYRARIYSAVQIGALLLLL